MSEYDDYDDYDPDEELTGSTLVPSTRFGRWSVRMATAMMIPLLLFYLFAARGLFSDGGFPDWLLLGPTALLGAAAAVLGILALAREERALLVYLAASIGATVALSGGASIFSG